MINATDLVASANDEVALEPAFQQLAREKLGSQGIEVEFLDESPYYWKFHRLPAGMTQTQADEILRGLMEHTIHGPWVFTIKK